MDWGDGDKVVDAGAPVAPSAVSWGQADNPVRQVGALENLGRQFVAGGGDLINTLGTVKRAMDPGAAITDALLSQQMQKLAPAGVAPAVVAQQISDAIHPEQSLARNAQDFGNLQQGEVASDLGSRVAGGIGRIVPNVAGAMATGGAASLDALVPSALAKVPVLGRVLTAIGRGAPTAAAMTTETGANLPDTMSAVDKAKAVALSGAENMAMAGLPVAVGSSPLVRTATGAGIGAAIPAGTAALHGQDQDAANNIVGAVLGGLLSNHGQARTEVPIDPHLAAYGASAPESVAPSAPAEPLALPAGADFTGQARVVRPGEQPVGPNGTVAVTPAGEAFTPSQGQAQVADVLQNALKDVPRALPAPVVNVDSSGTAMATADQNAKAIEAQNVAQSLIDATQQKRDLGITPDIERTQAVKWGQQDQQVRAEQSKQDALATVDNQIALHDAQNKPARGRNALPDEGVDDALTFLAKKGGLDRRAFISEGLDPRDARLPENNTRGGASRPLFRAVDKGGMSLDRAAETLWQHGYLLEQDNNAALDLIQSGVVQGDNHYSIHRQDQGDLMALEQQRRDIADHNTDFSDVPFSFAGERAQTADRGALAQAQQMEAMGRDSVPDREGNVPGSEADTHMATGWSRGKDGKWRFEIDDSAAKLNGSKLLSIDPESVATEKEMVTSAMDRAMRDGDHAEAQRLLQRRQELRGASLKGSTVGDVLNHPSLMESYPHLADVKVKVDQNMSGLGAYTPSENMIVIRPPTEYASAGARSLKSVLLHEIQHAIQTHEGFARGASVSEFKEPRTSERDQLNGRITAINKLLSESSRDGNKARYDQLLSERSKVVRQLDEKGLRNEVDIHDAAHKDYKRVAGEAEARNTQTRLDLSAADRRATPPSETEDVPRSQQIVKFGREPAMDEGETHVTQQDRAAIQELSQKLGRFASDNVRLAPADHVPDSVRRALAAFDEAFGGRTVVIRNETPDAIDFQGVTLRGNERFVNETSDAPITTVAGHEMLHQMRASHPELYSELADYVRQNADTLGHQRQVNKGRPDYLREDAANEELVADLTGDALSDPEFLDGMAKRNPQLFAKVVAYLKQALASIMSKLRSLGSANYLGRRELGAFRDKLEDVLTRYATERTSGPRAASGDDLAMSRRSEPEPQTQTKAFRDWFGDSKVVDADGQPLVVYHGTASDFDSFDTSKTGANDNGLWGRGHYFAASTESAGSYALRQGDGARVIPAYVSIKNPLVLKTGSDLVTRLPDGTDHMELVGANLDGAKIKKIAISGGHDGVIQIKPNGLIGDVVAYNNNQIKSATGNNGDFNPADNRITFSRRPSDDATTVEDAGKAAGEPDYLNDMPSRRPGESQAAYARRVMRKSRGELQAATALVKQQRQLGRYALRGMMATQARQAAIADATLNVARKNFDKTPDVINFASVNQWETGKHIDDADFRAFIEPMQAGFDQRIAEIRRLAPGALESLIRNYMPHMYEDSGKATKWYQNVMGKKPLQGDKSFLKQREWPTLKEAMASGLKPISPNPVDWVLMKYHQMDKFIGLLRLKQDFADRGWLMKMEAGQRPPEGFSRVDDPSFQIAGGLQGYYVVPDMIAKDINNYLAPGLSRYGAWRSMRAVQNAMVSWNLGWSAFHAGFTSIDNAVTHGAAGLQKLVQGDIMGGLKDLALSVPTMVTSPFEGGKLNRQWTGQVASDPNTAALLSLLEQGGARMKMGNVTAEYNNALPQLLRTIRRMQAPGHAADQLAAMKRRMDVEPAAELARTGWGALKGVGHLISAVGETGSFLIHHVLVPNQKMAARVTLLKFELDSYAKKLGKEKGDYAGIISVMNPDVAKQLSSDVVDKVDFRLGQMTYENFFYPKIAREIAQMLVMAPGWQAGAFQTMTGGLRDLGKIVKPEKLVAPLDKDGKITDAHRGRFTNNVANLAMLFLMVGGGNALYQWLVSGIEPDDAKDLVAPRTGRKNADDSDERIVLPSYMKDHYEFFHHPLAMASHKLHPAWRLMWEIGHNEDYFGNMIRDPHHPLAKQAKEMAGYLLKSMLPFTASNAAKVKENGGGAGQYAANFVGITPASASMARTKFQAFVAKGGEKGWDYPASTPAEAAYHDKQRKAETAIRTGKQPDLTGLTDKDVSNLHKRVQTMKPELQFARLGLADKLDAYQLATPQERERYHLTNMLQKTHPQKSVSFRRLPEEEQAALLDKLDKVVNGDEP